MRLLESLVIKGEKNGEKNKSTVSLFACSRKSFSWAVITNQVWET